MNPREKELAERSLWPLILKYSLPAIIGMLVNALYNVVDRFYIGRIPNIGADALSGLGVTFPIICAVLAFTLLIGIGGASCISIRLGKKDREGAEEVLGNVLSSAAAVSVMLSAAGILFADNALRFFGASDVTIVYASPYLKTYFTGTFFFVTGVAVNHSLRGSGSPYVSATTQVLGAVLNVILDPVFIFVFDMGVEGAAIATVISQAASFCWVMANAFSKKNTVKLRVKYLRPRLRILLRIASIGISPFLLQLAASAVNIVANHALKTYGGDNAIGAMTVISSVSTLFVMPLFGLNQGLQPILGYNYGAENYGRVKHALRHQMTLATAHLTLCYAVVMLAPSALVEFFILKSRESENLIQLATTGLPIFMLVLPLLGFQIPATNYFQSIGKAGVAIVVTLLRQVILLIPLYILLPRFFGMRGIWYAAPVSDSIAFLISAAVMAFERRRLAALPAPPEPVKGARA